MHDSCTPQPLVLRHPRHASHDCNLSNRVGAAHTTAAVVGRRSLAIGAAHTIAAVVGCRSLSIGAAHTTAAVFSHRSLAI